jgi:hypothetical protein
MAYGCRLSWTIADVDRGLVMLKAARSRATPSSSNPPLEGESFGPDQKLLGMAA